MFYFFGIHRFRKVLGSYGEASPCPHCGNTYSAKCVRINRWFHINFLPLIPLGFEYHRHCPVCWYSERVKKAELGSKSGFDLLVPGAVYHTLSKTYDLELKDADTGRRFRLLSAGPKSQYKKIIKQRGYKNIEIATQDD